MVSTKNTIFQYAKNKTKQNKNMALLRYFSVDTKIITNHQLLSSNKKKN